MKYLIDAGLIGTCAAAVAVRAGPCVPGLVLDSSSASTMTFRATCGAKLDLSEPYGVFTGPAGANRSLVGDYVPGAALSDDAVTINRALVADESNILVTATAADGETLLQSFALDDSSSSSAPIDDTTTAMVYEERSEAATCQTCSNPGILCQAKCQYPPKTCDFYSSCAEASLPCGGSGYALGYGLANCAKFMQRLSHFSSAGQAWIFRVMTCLQEFLISGPLVTCGLTCDALKTAAFGSHPTCYVDSGVCDLPVGDWVQLVITIRADLLTLDTLRQAVTTGGSCLGHYLEEIEEEIGKLKAELADAEDKAKVLAEMAVLKAVQKIFE